MYVYEYTDVTERTFPTLGIHAKKGDRIQSETPLNSPHLKEIKPPAEKPRKEVNNDAVNT